MPACEILSRITSQRVAYPHLADVVLVAGDLLVVWRAGQGPPGCNPAAGGLGCAVITRLAAPHQQQPEQADTDGER